MAAPIPAAMCNAHYKAARGLSLAPQQLRQLGDVRAIRRASSRVSPQLTSLGQTPDPGIKHNMSSPRRSGGGSSP
jgi:hypothetical protein